MSGCALDPIGLMIAAQSSLYDTVSPDVDLAPAYRSLSCEQLTAQLEQLNREFKAAGNRPPAGWLDSANGVLKVQGEKKCLALAAAAPQPTAPTVTTPATLVAAPTSAPAVVPRLATKFDAVPTTLSDALKIAPGRGAMVVSVQKGSIAERAGLQPLDVVLEIAGQAVRSAADVGAIVARMRDGYRVPMKVQGARGPRDIEVALGDAAPAARNAK